MRGHREVIRGAIREAIREVIREAIRGHHLRIGEAVDSLLTRDAAIVAIEPLVAVPSRLDEHLKQVENLRRQRVIKGPS